MTNQTTADPVAHFEEWARKRRLSTRSSERLSERSAVAYRYVWRAWVKYLAEVDSQGRKGHGVPWTEASLLLIERFLRDAVSPASARKSRSAPISDATRKRYLNLFDWLYQDAVNAGLARANPIRDENKVRVALKDTPGQVFNPTHWHAILEAFPNGESRWDVRDRAILALLMDAALTTSEVCKLTLGEVDEQKQPLILTITGNRIAQDRKLAINEATTRLLKDWLVIRRSMLGPNIEDARVFVSQKGYPMSPRPMFHLVATTVQRAMAQIGMPVPNHIGPAVLRNTRIVMWLNEEQAKLSDVLRRAGYKDFRSLRCLRMHVRSGILSGAVE